MRYLVPVARVLFASIFLLAVPRLLSPHMAAQVARAVPLAHVLVPLAGVLALLGGSSVAVGFHAKWGAGMLVLFLVPVTVMMHAFWAIPDAAAAKMQLMSFERNLSM